MSNLFLCSLGHSGSTLLDLLLGSHSRMVSLGEIHATLQRFGEPQNPCTCGRSADECTVWGPVRESWRAQPSLGYPVHYENLVRRVQEVYGAGTVCVDSSKHLPALQDLREDQRAELRVVFLVKDMRSFVASALGREKAARRWHTRRTLLQLVRWYRGNRRLRRSLDELGYEPFVLGYEELCFRPAAMLEKLCGFLGLPFEPGMVVPRTDRAHLLRGNRMRFDPESRSAIQYDARWLMGSQSLLTAPLYLPFQRTNRAWVYSNSAPAKSG